MKLKYLQEKLPTTNETEIVSCVNIVKQRKIWYFCHAIYSILTRRVIYEYFHIYVTRLLDTERLHELKLLFKRRLFMIRDCVQKLIVL